MNFSAFLSLFSGILTLFIGLNVFLINPKKQANIIFTIMVLFFTIFSFSEFLVRISESNSLALFFGRIGYSTFPLVSCLGLHFSLVFPRKYYVSKNIFSKYKFLIFIVYIIGFIIILILNTRIGIWDVRISDWGYRVIPSSSIELLVFWFLICSSYAAYTLGHTYLKKNINYNEKKQIQYLILGFLSIAALSLGTNLIPPILNISIFPMTTVSLLIFSILVAYSMIRYGLMGFSITETAKTLIDTMSDSLIVIDTNENIVNINKSTSDLLGYKKEEIIDLPLRKIFKIKEFNKRVSRSQSILNILENVSKSKLVNIESCFISNDGKNIPISISASPITNKKNAIEGYVIVARDLTELRETLKEKEILLKEIHHRVKNNLQLISSLLNIQSKQIKNKEVKEIFKESQNRIRLMASLHEQLYQSSDLKNIDFREYISAFTDNLFYSYKTNKNSVKININIQDIFLDTNTTLVCSFIINELVSNSLKHAFPNNKTGEITIDFEKKNKLYILTVKDNGIGFPKNINFQKTSSLGLQLVNMFVKQLNGEIKLDLTDGTKFIISFEYILDTEK